MDKYAYSQGFDAVCKKHGVSSDELRKFASVSLGTATPNPVAPNTAGTPSWLGKNLPWFLKYMKDPATLLGLLGAGGILAAGGGYLHKKLNEPKTPIERIKHMMKQYANVG